MQYLRAKRHLAGMVSLFLILFLAALTMASPVGSQTADDQSSALIAEALKPWKGDLDGIEERGMLRIATAYNPLFFAYEGTTRIGIVEDLAREFELFLEEKLGRDMTIVMMPSPRDRIIPAIVDGAADLAIANLTITEARAEQVAFSEPDRSDVAELVVTGPAAGDVDSFDDLVEFGLYLRPTSSYYGHVEELNDQRNSEGKTSIPLKKANENLEDYDLLDLVNAGLIPAIVVDSHKAALWQQVFDKITVHDDLAVHEGGEIAWAMRKASPKLQKVVNEFIDEARVGTLLGNILVNRYLGSTEWIEKFRQAEDAESYERIVELIRSYSNEYDFDWLMILAQAYQESKLRQNLVSQLGAVGVMQILPSTAADPNIDIEDVQELENNIHAGVKYLHFIRDRYFSDPEITDLDRLLLSFAAYNAGPAAIMRARNEAEALGLDPNIWFGNVETAAARAISREPVNYVRNIYKYYIAYDLSREVREQRQEATNSIEETSN